MAKKGNRKQDTKLDLVAQTMRKHAEKMVVSEARVEDGEILFTVWPGYTSGQYVMSAKAASELLSELNNLTPNLIAFPTVAEPYLKLLQSAIPIVNPPRSLDELLRNDVVLKFDTDPFNPKPMRIVTIELEELSPKGTPSLRRSFRLGVWGEEWGRFFVLPDITASRLEHCLARCLRFFD